MRIRHSLSFALATVAALSLPVAAQTVMMGSDTGRTIISASGQARQSLTPDRAVMTLLIEPQAMSVEEAASRLASVERAVLDTLRRFNLPASAIQTFNSGVVPYRSNMSPSSSPSFAGRSMVRVELTRIDQVGAISAAALAKGATSVSPSAFTASAQDSVRRALIPQAFQSSRREAEALAAAAGGRLGRLIDVGIPSMAFYPEQSQAMMAVNNLMYDNGQRFAPTTSVVVTVTTRWVLNKQ